MGFVLGVAIVVAAWSLFELVRYMVLLARETYK